MEKIPGMAPYGAGRFFFRLIQTLPTFWATWIWIWRIFIVCIFGGFKKSGFPGSQISKILSGPGLGQARPGLEPSGPNAC